MEDNLREEIKKWSQRLDNSLKITVAQSPKGVEFLTNIKAYQSDSLHFLKKNDLIRAYEALIWAWAYLEIGKQIGILSQR
ncbi:MAG: DUF357 domain-containing protein [Candidatus Aenigmarchaeota archaeon]|nr:DUF357 domain-containing protein [Candidatus Aenigmarchaeota archaeon]